MSASSIPTNLIRFVGIRPRVKKTAQGEARPTQVCIIGPDGSKGLHDLETEQAELDFVLGRFPTKWRKVAGEEDLSVFAEHHVIRDADKKPEKVPAAYEGLRAGDCVAMAMGGSGDYLAFALSRQSEKVGATVMRVPPFILKGKRADENKDDDAVLLATVAKDEPDLFTEVVVRDRSIVLVRVLYRLRMDTMAARMACAQRFRQRFIGQIFCSEEGKFPEGAIEKQFEEKKSEDTILLALIEEEKRINRELEKAVNATDVWKHVFEPVTGVGPAIAARLITAIQDIRRFSTNWKLRKFCGAHCNVDGSFPRQRRGEFAGWNPDTRQALYLLANQFFKRDESEWGKKLRARMAELRKKHPYPVIIVNRGKPEEEEIALVPGTFTKDSKGNYTFSKGQANERTVKGVMKYNDLHLRKTAMWQTASEFVDYIFEAWWNLEKKAPPVSDSAAAA